METRMDSFEIQELTVVQITRPGDLRTWLLNRAKDEFFSFDFSDFDDDFKEILARHADAIDPVSDDDTWSDYWSLLQKWQRDKEYISSLNLHKVIAKHVRRSCREANCIETIQNWVDLSSARLDGLADEIANGIRDAWKVRATWKARAVSKFSEKLDLDSLDKFHLGLESIIGYPPTYMDFFESMKREHEGGHTVFDDKKKREIEPKVEWNIVMQKDEWNIRGARCNPIELIPKRECSKPLTAYIDKAKQLFADAEVSGGKFDGLDKAEVAALRLWTGPMYYVYASLLRNPQKPSPYVTTLHAINSGITKLARIWQLPASRKVYRGYRKMRVHDLKKDSFQCIGGVERCVLATSEDFNIAAQYSEAGAFILEIDVGQVNRGADISWLSQFPHEKEILFNALSNVEFVCSPQRRFVAGRGAILTYQVRVSANLKSKTLEEFFKLRKDLHLNLVDVLTQEARQSISNWEEGSSGLITKLVGECKNRCDYVLKEAEDADANDFNRVTDQYVSLVKNTIMLKSRLMENIDLVLRWFETRKADPVDVDRLQDWQLEILRTCFQTSKTEERPTVTTIVLEPDCTVDSLFCQKSLNLGAIHAPDTVRIAAKLLRLNPQLQSLKIEAASAEFRSAEFWEKIFKELCPGRPSLKVNDIHIAQFAIRTLQRLELRISDDQKASMIVASLHLHAPRALTSLSFCGSPIACTGAESLGRAFSGLSKLRYVDLSSCNIASRGCTGISQNLSALTELEIFNLSHNIVGDEGFKILDSVISTHRFANLRSVDMRCNETQLPSEPCSRQCVIHNHMVRKFRGDGNVPCVHWSPQGELFASGSAKEIIIWDAKSGKTVLTISGKHAYDVSSVAWSPKGDQLVSGERGSALPPFYDPPGEILLFNATTGHQISSLKRHGMSVNSVSWSPDGGRIASGSDDKTMIIWDARTSKEVFICVGHTDSVLSVSWSPLGDKVASGSADKTIFIWEAKTGKRLSTLNIHSSGVNSVSWSRNCDRIASGSSDTSIIIWNEMTAATWEPTFVLKGHTSAVTSIAWSGGLEQIASSSSDRTIIIWNSKTGDRLITLNGHTSSVNCLAWNSWDNQIVSASVDKSIIVWDATAGVKLSQITGHLQVVKCLAWSPKGDKIVSGSFDEKIIIWDATTRDKVSTFDGNKGLVECVAWSPTGEQIASVSSDLTAIIIWNVNGSKIMTPATGACHTKWVNCVVWSPSGKQIASASDDTTIIIWNVGTGDPALTLRGHRKEVLCVSWSPHGTQIASGSRDTTIILWNAKTGEQVRTISGPGEWSWVRSVAWSPEGDEIVAAFQFEGTTGTTIVILNAENGCQVLALDGHTGTVNSVVWDPLGNRIASGSYDDSIIIWDAKTGDQIATLRGHSSNVTCVAWSPNGNHIASASEDKTIIIWHAGAGACGVHSAITTHDGDQIAGSEEGRCVPPAKKKKTGPGREDMMRGLCQSHL